ncbi:MAG TPA: hypothetical protein V6D00_06030 [Pantanalinema sp.]
MRRILVALGLAGLFWGAQALCSSQVGAFKTSMSGRLIVPDPQAAKLVVSDFNNLWADVLWVQVLIHNGDQHMAVDEASRDFGGMLEALELATDFDPRFHEAAIIGSWLLTDVGRLDDARQLLTKGMLSNPSMWIYPYQLGFVEFLYARRYAQAAEYFSRAASLPDGPPAAARMAAAMYSKSNKADMAINAWKNIHAKGDARIRGIARRALAKLGVAVDP